VYGKLDP